MSNIMSSKDVPKVQCVQEDKFFWLKHMSPKLCGFGGVLWYFYEFPPDTVFKWSLFGGIIICSVVALVVTWDGSNKVAPGKEV